MDYNITYRQRSGSWQYIISYKTDGKWKQKCKQGFKSKKDAKMFALDFIEKEPQTFIDISNDFNVDITLKELLDEYIYTQRFYQAAASISNMRFSINSFKELFDYKIINITERDLQKCVDNLIDRRLKYTTIKGKVSYCKLIFNYAIKKYPFIKTNPAANLKFIKDKTLLSHRRSLEPNEEKELLLALQTSDKYSKYYLATLLCLKTGLRVGEVGGLQFRDIDLNKKTISVNKQWKMIEAAKNSKYAKFGIGPLKSKNSNRIIPIPSDLFEILHDMKQIHNPNDFVVEFGETRSFQTTMNRDIKRLGFDVCIHELRHTYATKLISNGIDLKTVAYLMGHDLKMTIEVYSHVTNDMFNSAQKIIEKNL